MRALLSSFGMSRGLTGMCSSPGQTQCGSFIADSDDLTTPCVATADFGYLRLRRTNYTSRELTKWAGNEEKWREVEDSYIYFKHEENAPARICGENEKTFS